MYGAVGHGLPGTGEGGGKKMGPLGRIIAWVWMSVRPYPGPVHTGTLCTAAFPHSFFYVGVTVLAAAHKSSVRNWEIHHKVVASFMSPGQEKGSGKRYLKHLSSPQNKECR